MVDDLDVAAQVEDQFTDPLDDLIDHLLDVDRIADGVFPIEAEVDITQAVGELETLDEAIESVEDDVDIGADVDEDIPDEPSIGSTDDSDTTDDRDIDDTALNTDSMRVVAREVSILSDVDDGVLDDLGDSGDDSGDGGGFDSGVGMPDDPVDSVFDGNTTPDDVDLRTEGGVPQSERPVVPNEKIRQALFGRGGQPLDDAMAMPPDIGDSSFLDDLREDIDRIEPKMGTFFKALAAVLPLILAFGAAMPAAIAGVVALGAAAVSAAGVLGAIGGLGILGVGLQGGEFSTQPIQEELHELKTSFIEAFAPLAQEFAPLVRGLFDDLGRLFDAVAGRLSMLGQLEGQFSQLGDALVEHIPPIIESLARLGIAVMPVIEQLVGFFAQLDFGAIFGDILAKVLPQLRLFASMLVALLPALFELSRGFLDVITVVFTLLSLTLQLLNVFGPTLRFFGALIAVLLTLHTAASIASLSQRALAVVQERLALSAWQAATAVTVLAGALSLLLPVIGAIASAGTLTSLGSGQSNTRDELRSVDDGPPDSPGGGTTVNHYEVSAPDRQSANRTSESLSYQNSFTGGTKRNSEHSR